MNYTKFKRLVSAPENARVDFKIDCQAFASKHMAAKAELAKDICAMSNNGNVASYLIVGVSDDRLKFASVKNAKLTDDNLQAFVKDAIFPPPKVKLFRHKWHSGDMKHKDKEFVVIQIGPQVRRAFRVGRDFISHSEKVCHRRNEVWIRRGATSDLATPEEMSLLVKGKPPDSPDKPYPNFQYDKVLRSDQYRFVVNDIQECLGEIGGAVHNERLVVPIRKQRFVWRFAVVRQLATQFSAWETVANRWMYEHGFLLVALETVAKRAFHAHVRLHFEDTWGYFTVYDVPISLLPNPRNRFPVNSEPGCFATMALRRVRDTTALRDSLLGLMSFLEDNDDAYAAVKASRKTMNKNMRRWLRQGWLHGTGRYFVGCRPKRDVLQKNEVFDKRYGDQVLRRERPETLVKGVETILRLSSGVRK